MIKNVSVIYNGKEYSVPCGTLLSQIESMEKPCGGHARCGKCKVRAEGNLSPVSENERGFLTASEAENGIRLACMTKVQGDCRVYTLNNINGERIVSDTVIPEIDIKPVFSEYGVAIDVGTTTIAAALYDKNGVLCASESILNPQSIYGADVVSRIEASLGGNGEKLAVLVTEAIDKIVYSMAQRAGIGTNRIDNAVITGNTAMLYFLTNTSPEALSHAPFDAECLFGENVSAKSVGFKSFLPEMEVYLPSCISAFVGADTVCAVCASDILKKKKTALIADIGTNGEMALWHNGELYVCSTAAGPAFEGVGITMGMRASDGAVDKAFVLNGKVEISHIGDARPCGICGSGLVDIAACLLDTEEIDETGYLENDPYMLTESIMLTGSDIRMLQLAKSAIQAGILTLLHNAGITVSKVSDFCIAGGFGKYLNIKNAVRIGLLPDVDAKKVRLLGNAALGGAVMLLLNKNLREECKNIAKRAKLAELSTDPYFAEKYMMGMMF